MPGNSFKDKELAARAGRKSGKQKRTLEWEALAIDIVGKHSDRFNKILQTMDDEEFARQYINILNYFKPKLSSATVDAKTDININIKEPDWSEDDS